MTGDGLSIEARGCSAEETNKCSSECEVAYGIVLHEEFLSRFGLAGNSPGLNRSIPERVIEKSDLRPGKVALPMSPV